jgi:hypothetical protein
VVLEDSGRVVDVAVGVKIGFGVVIKLILT